MSAALVVNNAGPLPSALPVRGAPGLAPYQWRTFAVERRGGMDGADGFRLPGPVVTGTSMATAESARRFWRCNCKRAWRSAGNGSASK